MTARRRAFMPTKTGCGTSRPGLIGYGRWRDIAPDFDLRLSTASCLSARFPLISPSATLWVRRRVNEPATKSAIAEGGNAAADALTRVKQRLVDGGYYENSGFSTVNDALELLEPRQSGRWYPVVIQVAFEGTPARPLGDALAEHLQRPRAASGLLDWVLGFIHASVAHGDLAKSRLQARLTRMTALGTPAQDQFLPVTFIEDKIPMPRNWLISANTRYETQ